MSDIPLLTARDMPSYVTGCDCVPAGIFAGCDWFATGMPAIPSRGDANVPSHC